MPGPFGFGLFGFLMIRVIVKSYQELDTREWEPYALRPQNFEFRMFRTRKEFHRLLPRPLCGGSKSREATGVNPQEIGVFVVCRL